MILMYHHVCPAKQVPRDPVVLDSEGWAYNVEPEVLEQQLKSIKRREYSFVSMDEYVQSCQADGARRKLATVTFDDGWSDNFEFGIPVLSKLSIPACFFVVTGDSTSVPVNRRMDISQLRELVNQGMTIGGHSHSHRNLQELTSRELTAETAGCKDNLEQRLGHSIRYFAYPGGRFNRAAVQAAEDAGYKAVCSAIGGGTNNSESLFWLFRETLTPAASSLRNEALLSPLFKGIRQRRAEQRVQRMLSGG